MPRTLDGFWREREPGEARLGTEIMRAAKTGRLEELRELMDIVDAGAKRIGPLIPYRARDAAAKAGHMECVEFLHQRRPGLRKMAVGSRKRQRKPIRAWVNGAWVLVGRDGEVPQ